MHCQVFYYAGKWKLNGSLSLGQDCGDESDASPEAYGAEKNGEELCHGEEEGADLEAALRRQRYPLVLLDRTAEDEGHGVVQEALAEHDPVEHGVDVEILKKNKVESKSMPKTMSMSSCVTKLMTSTS